MEVWAVFRYISLNTELRISLRWASLEEVNQAVKAAVKTSCSLETAELQAHKRGNLPFY